MMSVCVFLEEIERDRDRKREIYRERKREGERFVRKKRRDSLCLYESMCIHISILHWYFPSLSEKKKKRVQFVRMMISYGKSS